VLGIPLQHALALQVTGDTVRDSVRQMGEFITGWRIYPAKPQLNLISLAEGRLALGPMYV
jgi:hypothetical protein